MLSRFGRAIALDQKELSFSQLEKRLAAFLIGAVAKHTSIFPLVYEERVCDVADFAALRWPQRFPDVS
jgi:hypothetical protein